MTAAETTLGSSAAAEGEDEDLVGPLTAPTAWEQQFRNTC